MPAMPRWLSCAADSGPIRTVADELLTP